jgi:hypothetical protein
MEKNFMQLRSSSMLIVMEIALLVLAGWGTGVLGVMLGVGLNVRRVHLQPLPAVER